MASVVFLLLLVAFVLLVFSNFVLFLYLRLSRLALAMELLW